ncbi:unnamed protein product [Trichobilharzia regenti]|nr:unnamed protein product [Trichobilharzia regenti]
MQAVTRKFRKVQRTLQYTNYNFFKRAISYYFHFPFFIRIHRPVQSLFSTSSGFNNFRGLLNLAGFLLLISTSRMALENILKYGIIMDPFSWIRFLLQAQQKCAVIGLLGCTNVFIIFAWLLERAIVRGLVGGKFAMALIWWNLLCLLAFPTIMILSIDFNPLFSAPVLGVYTIVLLKLYSYADVNRWCRQSTGNNEHEIDIALKNLGKPDFTKDDTFFNTNTITATSRSNHISSFATTVSSSKVKLSETLTTSIHSDNVETISQTVTGTSNSEDESTVEDQPVKRKCSPVLEDLSVSTQTEDAFIENDSSNEIKHDFKSVELQNEYTSESAEQFVVNRKIKTANFPADSNVSTKLKSSEYLNNLEAKHKSRVRKSSFYFIEKGYGNTALLRCKLLYFDKEKTRFDLQKTYESSHGVLQIRDLHLPI